LLLVTRFGALAAVLAGTTFTSIAVTGTLFTGLAVFNRLLWRCTMGFRKTQRCLLHSITRDHACVILARATVIVSTASTASTVTTSTLAGFTRLLVTFNRGFVLRYISAHFVALTTTATAITRSAFATVIAVATGCALWACLVAVGIRLACVWCIHTGNVGHSLHIAGFAVRIKTLALCSIAAFTTTATSATVTAVFTTVSAPVWASSINAWLAANVRALVVARFTTLCAVVVASTVAVAVAWATAFALFFRFDYRCSNWLRDWHWL
jgi:hypothetical protein